MGDLSVLGIGSTDYTLKDEKAKRYPTVNMGKLSAKNEEFLDPSGTVYNEITEEMKTGFDNGSFDGWHLGQVLKDQTTGIGWIVAGFDEYNECVILAAIDIPSAYAHPTVSRWLHGQILGDNPLEYLDWQAALVQSVASVLGFESPSDFELPQLLNSSYIPKDSSSNNILQRMIQNGKMAVLNYFSVDELMILSTGVSFAKVENVFGINLYRPDYSMLFIQQDQVPSFPVPLDKGLRRIFDNPMSETASSYYSESTGKVNTTMRQFPIFKNFDFRKTLLSAGSWAFNNLTFVGNTGCFLMYDASASSVIPSTNANLTSTLLMPVLYVKPY